MKHFPELGVCVSSGFPWRLGLTEPDMRSMETAATIQSLLPQVYTFLDGEVYIPPMLPEAAIPHMSAEEQAKKAIEVALDDKQCLELISSGLHDYTLQREQAGKAAVLDLYVPTALQQKTYTAVPLEALWDYWSFTVYASSMVGIGSRLLIKQVIESFDSVNDQWRAAEIADGLNSHPSVWWENAPKIKTV